MKKLVPLHLQKTRDKVRKEKVEDVPPPPLPPPLGRLRRPNKWCVIDVLGEDYQRAVSH